MPTQVFLSRPTRFACAFQRGVDGLMNALESLELVPRTLGVSDYPNESPLSEVVSLIKTTRGALILGIPQIQIENATFRGESMNPCALPTEWNHIEASLAFSVGRPLLLIHHQTVCRGVFDRGAIDAFLHSVDMTDPAWPLEQSIQGALRSWKEKVLRSADFGAFEEKQIDMQDAKLMNLENDLKQDGYRIFWCKPDELDRCLEYWGYERIVWRKPDGSEVLLTGRPGKTIPLKTSLSVEESSKLREGTKRWPQ